MRKLNYSPTLLLAVIATIFSSCTKDIASKTKTTTSSATSSTTSTLAGTIAIGTVADATTPSVKDTLYLVNCFTPHSKPDSVALSALPAAISTYLTANYAGYTFKIAFKVLDSLGTASGYIVVINYNGNPVGLKFTTTGTFVQVLEQMVGPGPGGHGGPGGMNPNAPPFQGRDGGHPDSVALSALPAAVTSYFSIKYPGDTLLHASITPDSTYILISKDNGLFSTAISKTGTLINRMEIPGPPGMPAPIAEASLPAAATAYLTATYPGYVFDKEFVDEQNGSTKGYDVFITSNSTNYVITFDASGNFVKACVLH